MSERSRAAFRVPAAVVVLALVFGLAAAEETLIAEQAAGRVPLAGESTVELRGFAGGSLLVRAGREPELRFAAVDPDDRGREIPVRLLADGTTLRIEPAGASEAPAPVRLEVLVPADFAARVVETAETTVEIQALSGGTEITGRRLDVGLRDVGGTVRLELAGGRVGAGGTRGDLDLDLTDVGASFDGVAGEIWATLAGGSLAAGRVGGPVELDARGTDLRFSDAGGTIRARCDGGSIEIAGAAEGAAVRLTGTALAISESRGVLDIETDARVTIRAHDGEAHVNGYRASVEVAEHSGLLEILTDDSTVSATTVRGPMRVKGNGLTLTLEGIGGELIVLASSSEVDIRGTDQHVHVENEFGDVRIHDTKQTLEVSVRDGNARLTGLNGPVDVEVEGYELAVGFASLAMRDDSRIVNTRGDIELGLPSGGTGRVEIEAGFGGVESDHPDVVPTQDGRRAAGTFGRGGSPVIRVEADGSVRVVESGGAPAVE